MMLALYRSGRQVEALDAYLEARHALVNEVGVDPSEELQRLRPDSASGTGSEAHDRRAHATAATDTLPRPRARAWRRPPPAPSRRGAFADAHRCRRLGERRGSRFKPRSRQADRHPAGVFWVPLAPLGDPGRVVDAIVTAVGPLDGLTQKRLLLVVDNFEHVLPASNVLSEMIAANRTCVCSSRVASHCGWRPSTNTPFRRWTSRTRCACSPNARAATTTTRTCGRSAAGWTAFRWRSSSRRHSKLLATDELLARLSDPLPLLTHGPRDARPAPSAQNCDRVGYDLLAEDEQRLCTTRDLRRRLDDRRGRGGVRRRSRHAPVGNEPRASSTATQSVTGCSRQSARSPPNASKRPVRPPSCDGVTRPTTCTGSSG